MAPYDLSEFNGFYAGLDQQSDDAFGWGYLPFGSQFTSEWPSFEEWTSVGGNDSEPIVNHEYQQATIYGGPSSYLGQQEDERLRGVAAHLMWQSRQPIVEAAGNVKAEPSLLVDGFEIVEAVPAQEVAAMVQEAAVVEQQASTVTKPKVKAMLIDLTKKVNKGANEKYGRPLNDEEMMFALWDEVHREELATDTKIRYTTGGGNPETKPVWQLRALIADLNEKNLPFNFHWAKPEHRGLLQRFAARNGPTEPIVSDSEIRGRLIMQGNADKSEAAKAVAAPKRKRSVEDDAVPAPSKRAKVQARESAAVRSSPIRSAPPAVVEPAVQQKAKSVAPAPSIEDHEDLDGEYVLEDEEEKDAGHSHAGRIELVDVELLMEERRKELAELEAKTAKEEEVAVDDEVDSLFDEDEAQETDSLFDEDEG